MEGVLNSTDPRELRTVSECLEAFQREDTSTGYSMICRQCDGRPEVVSKQTKVLRAPRILVLNIDREEPDDSGAANTRYGASSSWQNYGWRSKSDRLVEYPISRQEPLE